MYIYLCLGFILYSSSMIHRLRKLFLRSLNNFGTGFASPRRRPDFRVSGMEDPSRPSLPFADMRSRTRGGGVTDLLPASEPRLSVSSAFPRFRPVTPPYPLRSPPIVLPCRIILSFISGPEFRWQGNRSSARLSFLVPLRLEDPPRLSLPIPDVRLGPCRTRDDGDPVSVRPDGLPPRVS